MLQSTDDQAAAPSPHFNVHRFRNARGQVADDNRQEFVVVAGVTGKVVFIGDPRCGKTTLVQAISKRNTQFRDPHLTPAAPSEDFCPIDVTFTTMVPEEFARIPIPQAVNSPSIVVLDVCDLSRKFSMSAASAERYSQSESQGGGSGRINLALKAYLSDVVIAVLVFDLQRQETLESIAGWIRLISRHRTEPDRKPLAAMLVGNKRDAWYKQVSESDALRFSHSWNLSYMETSATSEADIDELCVRLVRMVHHIALHNYALNHLVGKSQCPPGCTEIASHRHVYYEFQAGSAIELLDKGRRLIQFPHQQHPQWARVPYSPHTETGSDELSRWLSADDSDYHPVQEPTAGVLVRVDPKIPNTALSNPAAPPASERASLLFWEPPMQRGLSAWLIEKLRWFYSGSVGLLCLSPAAIPTLEED